MTNLVPYRHHPDLFIADLMTVPLKELAEHLEFPFFGLAPQPYYGVRRFDVKSRSILTHESRSILTHLPGLFLPSRIF